MGKLLDFIDRINPYDPGHNPGPVGKLIDRHNPYDPGYSGLPKTKLGKFLSGLGKKRPKK